MFFLYFTMSQKDPKLYISIQTVLNHINTPLDGNKTRVFSLGWIRTTGEAIGTFKYVPAAMKYGSKGVSTAEKPREMPNLKIEKLLLLEDIQLNQAFLVKIHSIIEYNGIRVRH